MSINRFFTTLFAVLRSQWSGESSSLISETSFFGHLQQATSQLAESLHLAYTRTFTVWCDVNTDVQEGDLIRDGEYDYSVRAIRKLNYGGNQHLNLIVERHEDYLSV